MLEKFPKAKVLGTTATPIRHLDFGKNMAKILFKENIYEELGLSGAIARGILPMPKYVSTVVNIEESMESLKFKLDKKNIDDTTYNKVADDIRAFKYKWENNNNIEEIFKKHITDDMCKFIVFCKNIEHLELMKDSIPSIMKKIFKDKTINVYEVSSRNTGNKKDFKNFKNVNDRNTLDLLFTIDMLNEGVHFEELMEFNKEEKKNFSINIMLFRKTKSNIVYQQQLGRALSVKTSNIPLVIDFVDNISSMSECSLRKDLLSTLSLVEDERNRILRFRRDYEDLKHIEFLLHDETIEIEAFMNQINERLTITLDDIATLIEKYHERYNTFRVKDTESLDGEFYNIKSHIRKIRQSYKNNALDKSIVDRLNKIEFTWNSRDDEWVEKLELYKNYIKKENTYAVKRMGNANKSLSKWIDDQNRAFNNNELSEFRITQLNKIKYPWRPTKENDIKEKVKLLLFYKEKYGTVNIRKMQKRVKSIKNYSNGVHI